MLATGLLAIAIAPLTAVQTPAVEAKCHEMFVLCRSMLTQKQAAPAKNCFDDYLATCPDGADVALAQAMAGVAAALVEQATSGPQSANATVVSTEPAQPFSVSEFAQSGLPELVLTSTAFGGVSGFVAAATMLSALRTSTDDSTPVILARPLLGAVGGLATSSLLSWWLQPTPGQAALFSSSMWLGTAYGIVLQYALFDGLAPLHSERPEHETPWRFVTVLGSGALALGTAALGSRYLPIDPGDVGLINSAALWGSLVPLFGALSAGVPFSNNGVAIPVFLLATSLLAVDGAVIAAPWVKVPRPATWLIDAGGVLGMLVGLATWPVLAAGGASNSALMGYTFTAATAAGVMAGTVGCLLLGNLLGDDTKLAGLPPPLLAPVLLPDPDHPERSPLPGLTLAARF